ncbi:hypothetical protein Esti_001458 [Eimeria stiedai]
MSIFSQVAVAAPDAILGTAIAFRQDSSPTKVNLGIGAYRTDEGFPYVFPVVREVEKGLVNDRSLDKEYLPIDGLAELKPASHISFSPPQPHPLSVVHPRLTQKLVFGENSKVLKEGRVASCQSLSGTGALRVAADFIASFLPNCKCVYLSKPTWSNHHNIFGLAAGLDIREYRYWDPATKGVEFEGLLEDLEEAPLTSVLVLHACAHNPTGVDITEAQWAEVLKVCDRRHLLPVIDLAYQGFATGDLERDALAVRMFADKFSGAFFVAQSFAKNLGLYGERIGMLHAVCATPGEADAVLSQLKVVARRMYSSPPLHGARILARILSSEERVQQWQAQLRCVAERIKRARELLRNGLEKKKTPGSWHHITDQIGMFSFTGLSREQCELLISKWHIYLLKNGRISIMAALWRWGLGSVPRRATLAALSADGCAPAATAAASTLLPSCFQQARGFGAGDLKIVAARMKSVKSIQKITKAMKMVAASKLRMDQKRLENGMPFALPVQRLVERMPVPEDKSDLTVLALTSDKGLCGGVNSSVCRLVRDTVKAAEGSGSRSLIIGVGDKVRSGLQRIFGDRFNRMITEVTRFPWSFANASAIAERIIKEDPARLVVVYNHFKSAVSYETLLLNLLTGRQAAKSTKQELAAFECEPELTEVWKDLHDFYCACTVYGCMLDNIASEQSARMSAMDNASTNAGEMISALTLRYNRARQAKITTELVEIISGANALE